MDEKQDNEGRRRFSWVDLGIIFFVGVFIGDAIGITLVGLTAISIVGLVLFYLFCVRPVRGMEW